MYLLSVEESFNKPRYPLNNEINTSRLITGFVLFGGRVFQQRLVFQWVRSVESVLLICLVFCVVL